MKNLAAILLVVNIMHAQDCNPEEVEIWGLCYSIENTTILQNIDNTSGDFPNEICELINLEILDLDVMWGATNQISGQIPDCIGNLVNLTTLNLGWNYMYGEIPQTIGSLTNLTFLNLLSNDFYGEIPESIENLTNLTYLNLGLNYFSGSIPEI